MDSDPIYLAIDPGETAGFCLFNEAGDPIKYGQFRYEKAVKELDALFVPTIKVCITEDFKNYPWMGHKNDWGDNKTSQMLGKIDMMCEMREVEYVKQMANCKEMGFMYMGMKEPTNHSISHQFVAMAHGVFYLQATGINPPGKFMPDES